MEYALGSVAIAALVFGLVEAAKEFGVQGKWSRLLALILGGLFVGLHSLHEQT